MLATPATVLPQGAAWRHEIKWDGMRALIEVSRNGVRIFSRTERDITIAFPELVQPDAGLADFEDLLLDAEIVVMRDGVPSFAALSDRFNVVDAPTADQLAAQAPVTAMVFDVLRAMGRDVTRRPWSQRRELLEGIGLGSRWVTVPPVFDDGDALLEATAERGMEGVVSKNVDAPYRPGTRSEDWLKLVHRRTDSFVVIGWRRERGATGLGAVLLAAPVGGRLVYRGRVGSGLAGRRGTALAERLLPLRREAPVTVDEIPADDAEATVWVDPALVADVEFHGISAGGRLRQPTWRGVRDDLTPEDLG